MILTEVFTAKDTIHEKGQKLGQFLKQARLSRSLPLEAAALLYPMELTKMLTLENTGMINDNKICRLWQIADRLGYKVRIELSD